MGKEEFEALVEADMIASQQMEQGKTFLSDDETEDIAEDSLAEPANAGVTAKECLRSLANVRAYSQEKALELPIQVALRMVENECLLDHDSTDVQKRKTNFFQQ